MAFENFDFKLLDDPDFKEDSVREELIVPMLRRLGYSASGPARILRSKALTHPFVYIGSTSHHISVIPDYLLVVDENHKWILDAKAPNENILAGKHLQQAFSYAIHPEVRAFRYALCNGRQLVVFDVQKIDPDLVQDMESLDQDFRAVERLLSPIAFTKPHVLDFQPDMGLYLLKAGAPPDMTLHFTEIGVPMLAKVEDGRYTMFVSIGMGGDKLAASFDFDEQRYAQLLASLDDQTREKISSALKRQPYKIHFEDPPVVCLHAQIGPTIHTNEDESYCPFDVLGFEKAIV